RPAAFIKPVGAERIYWFHLDSLICPEFFQRDQMLTFASLHRHCTALLAGEEMFQRREKIGTQSSFLLADSIQIAPLQQQREKTLSKIFRVLSPYALSSHETINRSPISAAEFFQRLLCR